MRLQRLDLHVRVREHQQHRGAFHLGSRLHVDALDATGGQRSNPENLLRDQCPRATDAPHHLTALHHIGVDGVLVDAGRGGPQSAQRHRDDHNGQYAAGHVDPAFLLAFRFARDIHNNNSGDS